MGDETKTYDTFLNLVILFWLFLPIIFLVFSLSFLILSTNFNLTLNESNIRFIIGAFFDSGSGIQFDKITLTLTLLGSFLIYCYIFNMIRNKGFSVFRMEENDSKFFSALPYLFFSSILIMVTLLVFFPKIFEYKQSEILYIIPFLIVLFASFLLFAFFSKDAITYDGLKRINEIKKPTNTTFWKFTKRDFTKRDLISYCYSYFDLFSFLLFIFSVLLAIVWFKSNMNLITLIIVETTFLYLNLLYSSISLIPKKMYSLSFKENNIEPIVDFFMLSEASEDYYSALLSDNTIKFINKDSVSVIVPNLEFEKISEFKLRNPIDTIKDLLTVRNILYLVGIQILFAFTVTIIGIVTFALAFVLLPPMFVAIFIYGLIIFGVILLGYLLKKRYEK